MRDFLRICLVKDPVLRPSSDELMSHPWITKINTEEEMKAAREAFLKILIPFRETKIDPEKILIASSAKKPNDHSILEPSRSG